MERDEETASAIVALLLVKKNKKKRKRSVWVKPWLRRRISLGLYETHRCHPISTFLLPRLQ